jgi:hypothetical protein
MYQVDVYESERWWWRSLIDSFIYNTLEEANEKVSSVNSKNTSETVPDYYIFANEPYLVQPKNNI